MFHYYLLSFGCMSRMLMRLELQKPFSSMHSRFRNIHRQSEKEIKTNERSTGVFLPCLFPLRNKICFRLHTFYFFFLSTAIILIATAAAKAHTVMQHTKQAQARKRYIQNGFGSDSCSKSDSE